MMRSAVRRRIPERFHRPPVSKTEGGEPANRVALCRHRRLVILAIFKHVELGITYSSVESVT